MSRIYMCSRDVEIISTSNIQGLQPWVLTLSLAEQTVLISILRGVGGPTSIFNTMLRPLILNKAVEIDEVLNRRDLKDVVTIEQEEREPWLEVDVKHLLTIAKLVGEYHPNPYVRIYWKGLVKEDIIIIFERVKNV